ncbi:acetamidase/formamidase family protein [Kaistia dalseonensis]|uniref:Acetamidase/formamidase n=1 Tax=Kaistia dalseonensis TaxID=410840 RepID=A0ABU0H0F1_9HYPH|nr:acetamidase/formamidase family protein [Kaistia dalseonensis]MCX5493234.1 acetamidase/formamidase family protein [Kaistia dalseonensis]MDQ0435789.1 acetamidase/formamidase [Kaistia dalseonensis]
MSRNHSIAATRETVHWGYFDAKIPAIERIRSGDTITVDTLSGDAAYLPTDPAMEVLADHRAVLDNMPEGPGPHFMTGPFFVEGAEPGDTLKVEILDIKLRQNWGWNVIAPLFGTLQEDFDTYRLLHAGIDRERGVVSMPWGLELPAAPFFGVMGTAPPPAWGSVSSVVPRSFGGNIDNKELVSGTTLYLPVFNDGALFSVGDGHAMQGNGEVCVTAIETALSGTMRLTVEKGTGLQLPWAETPTHYMTMGFDEDLDDAAKQALRAMIAFIVSRTTLSREDAYSLCSIAADLAVTQTVDVNKGIHVMLPKYTIDGSRG